MSDFTFEVIHLPGTENKAADALSRAHVVSALEIGEEAKQHQLRGWGEVQEAAAKDNEYVCEREEIEQGKKGRGKEVRQGVILDQIERVIVPQDEALYAKIILEAYELPFCGHFGTKRMLEIVLRNFW